MTFNRIRHIYFPIIFILSVLISAGCSENTRPDILEPVIELSEASDISRTEATLTVSIDRRGKAKITYITLFFSEATDGTLKEISGNPESNNLMFHLTELKPGENYTCHIEGGTATAKLISNTISFSTIPNETPKISAPIPLSTGPLGIIVEFSITDDGGESITEAGCEIKTAGTSDVRYTYIPEEQHDKGEWQIYIHELTPLTTYTITPFASNSIGKAYGEALEYTTKNSIVLQQPGQLSELFKYANDIELEPLTISGLMNGDDFRMLRTILGAPINFDGNPSGIKSSNIDLTDVMITEGGASYDGNRFTSADELTTDIFADCILLHSAILPNVKRIARNAFERCKALETLMISAETEQILPSSDCIALKEINVSKANRHFSTIDGVLFNHEATEILWFPYAKSGEYQIPQSVTTIGENAFAETCITSLIVPSSVTTIKRGAFAGSSLKEIHLPETISNISEGLFQNCSSLTTVYLGSGTEFVGDYAFDGSDISDIYLAATIPPFANAYAFVNNIKPLAENCILHVPTGTKKTYQNHERWGTFNKIEEF